MQPLYCFISFIQLTYMYNSPTVEPGDVIKASYQLSQMLAPQNSDGSARTNTADEYSVLVESLEMLVALPSRLPECRPSDLNNFANVSDNSFLSRFISQKHNVIHYLLDT